MDLLPPIDFSDEETETEILKEEIVKKETEITSEKEEEKIEYPFIEIPIKEKKKKKRIKKIVSEIDENNIIEPSFNNISQLTEEEKTRDLIKETIKNEMYEIKQIKKVKIKKPLSEKQLLHLDNMRKKAKDKRDEKLRIKELEDKLKLKDDISKEKMDTYIKNKIEEEHKKIKKETIEPVKIIKKEIQLPVKKTMVPSKFITSNLNPINSRKQKHTDYNYDNLFNY
jgi:hypothetical protein